MTGVVCLGGGHGLHATLSAVRLLTSDVTAIVCVGDDGGSSGRLRDEFGVLPPGDIRMALSALASRRATERGVVKLLQHRFTSEGSLGGHALGNLVLTALWQQTADPLVGIRAAQTIFDIDGTVIPGAKVPLTLTADVQDLVTGRVTQVRSQREVAKAKGRILSLRINPDDPPAFAEAVEAIESADLITLGPGSWYSSLLVHLLVPDIRRALHRSRARKVLIMNLLSDWETTGQDPQSLWHEFQSYSQDLRIDAVLADDSMRAAAFQPAGTPVFFRRIAASESPGTHDPIRLTSAIKDVVESFGTSLAVG